MYTISIRNMTQVGSTEILIYSDESVDPAYKLETSNLKREEGSAGSLTLRVPVGNAGYDEFEELSTQVIVRKDTVSDSNKVHWIGRLLSVKIDFNNTKELVFEGIFNYLMDTIQLPSKSECKLESWVDFLLTNHNAICTASGEHYKKVYKGLFDQTIDQTAQEFYTNYETSQEMINNAIQYYESHVIFRYVWDSTNGCYNLYLDFYKDYRTTANPPVISFGQNLMDYSRTYETEELATVIIPRGERYSDKDWETYVLNAQNPPEDKTAPAELDHYHTVWSCITTTDHTNHQYTVYADQTMVDRYGYVSKTIDFDGITEPNTLLLLARDYLTNQKWIKLSIDISAVDMKLLSPGINLDEINIGLMIHCISQPHGLNYFYPCTGIEEDILDVSGTRYTLGTGDVQYLTDAARNTDDKLKEIVRKNVEREDILTQNILHKPLNDFDQIKASMDALEDEVNNDINTVKTDAKGYALNLLNIYDNELNPNNKGYVHFKRINSDYSGLVSVGDVRRRLKSVYSADYSSWIDQLLDSILFYWDNTDYIVTMALGSQANQVAISVWELSYNDKANNQGDAYLKYNAVSKFFSGEYRWHTPSNVYYILSNGQLYGGSGTGTDSSWQAYLTHNPFGAPAQQYTSLLDRLIYPSEYNMNSEEFTFYCNRNVYSAQTGGSIVLTANFSKSEDPVGAPSDHIYEICISDNLDFTKGNVWRWNKTGLYFIEKGSYSTNADVSLDTDHGVYQNQADTLRVGITNDGSIVADRISVGILNADIIKTGVIRSRPVGSAEPDGNMMIDIPNGNIIAKKGTLIFNDARTTSYGLGIMAQPMDGFIYLSNVNMQTNTDPPQPVYISCSGETGKNDWRLVIGDSFGVDSAGRAYMREGIVGATGGLFQVKAKNSNYVTLSPNTTDHVWEWSVRFNTDASRPLSDSSASEQANFRFRLAHYDSNNEYVFVSKLYSFLFPPGHDDYVFSGMPFYPAISHASGDPAPYYQGELFPVWYTQNDSATEDYYEQDGHRYVLGTSNITATTDLEPKYTSETGLRMGSSSSSQNGGAVRIGSGYLYNGTFGQNKSFYLGGIKNSGTVANNTRDDWRFAVGSKFGVTENGTLYCTGGVMRNMDVDASISASYVNTSNVGGVLLNAKNPENGEIFTYTFKIVSNWYGSTQTASIRMYLSAGCKDNLSTSYHEDFLPDEHGDISQSDFYGNVAFEINIAGIFSGPGHADPVSVSHKFNFTYLKSTTTGYQGAHPQVFSIGDVSGWTTGPASTDHFDYFDILVTMTNERTGDSRPTWEMSSWTVNSQNEDGFEGTMVVTRLNSGTQRPAVNIGSRDLISEGRWIGGPSRHWADGYINHLHQDTSGTSSSKIYKNNIRDMSDEYDEIFDELRPVTYYLNKEEDKVRHTGFIMEEIGDILDKHNINHKDFAAYRPNPYGEGGELLYDEFIAMNVRQIQKLKKRVEELEKQLYERGLFDDTDD